MRGWACHPEVVQPCSRNARKWDDKENTFEFGKCSECERMTSSEIRWEMLKDGVMIRTWNSMHWLPLQPSPWESSLYNALNVDMYVHRKSMLPWHRPHLIKSGARIRSSSKIITLSAVEKYLKAWKMENLMCSLILMLVPGRAGLLWNTTGRPSTFAKSNASFWLPSTDRRIGVTPPPAWDHSWRIWLRVHRGRKIDKIDANFVMFCFYTYCFIFNQFWSLWSHFFSSVYSS